MHKRARALIRYGEECGFTLSPSVDGNGHYLLVHLNGSRVRVAATPGDLRGDENARAEMRRKSGVTPKRANAGHYKKGIGREQVRTPAQERIDSRSRHVAVLRKSHREVCDRIDACRISRDRDGAAEAISQLLDIEAQFSHIGVQAPVRRFRVW